MAEAIKRLRSSTTSLPAASEHIPRFKMVYLSSLHNSGSTVMAILANSHPALVSPGEMFGVGTSLQGPEGPTCSCGELVAACSFWREVANGHTERGFTWSPSNWRLQYELDGWPKLGRLVFGRPDRFAFRLRVAAMLPGLGRRVKELNDRNRSFAWSILKASGKQVILDATKYAHRIAYYSLYDSFDLHLIHLIRDPRGWCSSRLHNTARDAPGAKPTPEWLALQWVRGNRYIERMAQLVPASKRIQMRYCDLCENPQSAMDQVFRLASLPTHPVPDDIRTITHHLFGNRMRERGDARVRLDTTWKEKLTAQQIATITRITRDHARTYDYSF